MDVASFLLVSFLLPLCRRMRKIDVFSLSVSSSSSEHPLLAALHGKTLFAVTREDGQRQ